jgi:integrase/recombinase XerD
MARLAPLPKTAALTLSDAVAQWVTSMRARNIAPRTIDQYTYAMDVVQDILGHDHYVLELRPEHIEQVVVTLHQRGWKAASVSSVYRPWRTLMNFLVARDFIPASPFAKTRAPFVEVVPPPAIPVEDLRRLLATCQSRSKHNYRGVRDEAILRILASTGLRLSECTNLTLNDVDLLNTVPTVTVLGKGRRVRTVPLDPATAVALRTYIQRERPRSPWAASDRVWLASKGPMTAQGLYQLVRDRAAKIGLDLHPHSLRHFAIQGMLRAGMSEGDTMAISGHSTRSMLDRYSAADRADRARQAFLQAPRAAL